MFTIIGSVALTLAVSLISYEIGKDKGESEHEEEVKSVDEVIAHFEEVKR